MRWQTKLLRVLLCMAMFALLLGCGLLFLVSLDAARNWPAFAYLRLPVYIAIVVGLTPIVGAIKSAFDFLTIVDNGDVFSADTIRILRRIRLLIGVFAAYFTLGLVAFWITTRLMHPTLLFEWFALEIAALFLFTMLALLERLFTAALELRQDNELTV